MTLDVYGGRKTTKQLTNAKILWSLRHSECKRVKPFKQAGPYKFDCEKTRKKHFFWKQDLVSIIFLNMNERKRKYSLYSTYHKCLYLMLLKNTEFFTGAYRKNSKYWDMYV